MQNTTIGAEELADIFYVSNVVRGQKLESY
jgi:hypothetical protein